MKSKLILLGTLYLQFQKEWGDLAEKFCIMALSQFSRAFFSLFKNYATSKWIHISYFVSYVVRENCLILAQLVRDILLFISFGSYRISPLENLSCDELGPPDLSHLVRRSENGYLFNFKGGGGLNQIYLFLRFLSCQGYVFQRKIGILEQQIFLLSYALWVKNYENGKVLQTSIVK